MSRAQADAGFGGYLSEFWESFGKTLVDRQDFMPPAVGEAIRNAGKKASPALRGLCLFTWKYQPELDPVEVLDAAGKHVYLPGGRPDLLLKASTGDKDKAWHAVFYGEGDELADRVETFASLVGDYGSDALPREMQKDVMAWKGDRPKQTKMVVLVTSDKMLDETTYARVAEAMRKLQANLAKRHLDWACFSVRTAYGYQTDGRADFSLPLRFKFATRTGDTIVGSVALDDLYRFMEEFQKRAQDLNMLYEENIRFEKPSSKVNAGMLATLADPEEVGNFGFYNNGVTIVADGVELRDGTATVLSPQVINGCQTTRTIFRFVREQCVLEDRGFGILDGAFVPVKLLNIPTASEEDEEVRAKKVKQITTFANSQNKVKDVELVKHDPRMKQLKAYLAGQGVFLELQSGSWKALGEQAKAEGVKTEDLVRAAAATYFANPGDAYGRTPELLPDGGTLRTEELVRTMGATYLANPGDAYGTAKAMLPGGSSVKAEELLRTMGAYALDEPGLAYAGINHFGQDNPNAYYAHITGLDNPCFLAAVAMRSAMQERYTKAALSNHPARKNTQYLFYHVVSRLLVPLLGTEEEPATAETLARFVLAPGNREFMSRVYDSAARVLDSYMDETEGVFRKEPLFTAKSSDRNKFLKSPELGDPKHCPQLAGVIGYAVQELKPHFPGRPTADTATPPVLKETEAQEPVSFEAAKDADEAAAEGDVDAGVDDAAATSPELRVLDAPAEAASDDGVALARKYHMLAIADKLEHALPEEDWQKMPKGDKHLRAAELLADRATGRTGVAYEQLLFAGGGRTLLWGREGEPGDGLRAYVLVHSTLTHVSSGIDADTEVAEWVRALRKAASPDAEPGGGKALAKADLSKLEPVMKFLENGKDDATRREADFVFITEHPLAGDMRSSVEASLRENILVGPHRSMGVRFLSLDELCVRKDQTAAMDARAGHERRVVEAAEAVVKTLHGREGIVLGTDLMAAASGAVDGLTGDELLEAVRSRVAGIRIIHDGTSVGELVVKRL